MKGAWARALPVIFILVAAASRWPGLLPPSFSVFYGLAFVAGALMAGRLAWWLPLGTLLVTDLALNVHYTLKLGQSAFQPYQFLNYAAFAGLILLGRQFGPRASLGRLVGGGVLGAFLFWLLTNTAAWLFNPFANPEYSRTLAGWWLALTQGTAGHPPTWTFLRNTLVSGALFSALFAAALQWAAKEPEPEEELEPAEEPAPGPKVEEA
ncbi:MAG TPA: hypothetical protein PKE47_16985 [Verrucomicrobiota bacterium]|nr:hypothetical protein [Verrucomicrobiota bacterium]